MKIDEDDARRPREPMTAVVRRWPVVERKRNDSGRLIRTNAGFVRTKKVLEEKTLECFEFLPSRVSVCFALSTEWFSLRTGRGIGRQDWVLAPESLMALRKEARALFPKEPPETPANDLHP